LRKSVTTDSDRAQRGKLLERKLHHCSKFKIPKPNTNPRLSSFASLRMTTRKASRLLEN
jgi:hypothetical protein